MKKAKPALLRDKMPAPASLNRSVAKAKARTTERRHGPPLWLKRADSGQILLEDGNPVWEWPFADTLGESPDWAWLVLEALDRQSVVEGKGVYVSEDFGGGRSLQK